MYFIEHRKHLGTFGQTPESKMRHQAQQSHHSILLFVFRSACTEEDDSS